MLSDVVSYIIQDELFVFFGNKKGVFRKIQIKPLRSNILKIYIITSQFNFDISPYLKAGTRYMRQYRSTNQCTFTLF